MIDFKLFIDFILLTFILVLAIAIARLDDLFSAVILTGIFSLLTACLYLTMDAVDVAFTEAAVGGGIATILLISAVALTTSKQQPSNRSCIPACCIVLLAAITLIYGIFDITPFGTGNSPVHQYLADRYVLQSPTEIGIPNMVTSILASYRGYDTLGEVTVIFTAGIAVLMLLGGRESSDTKQGNANKDT